MNADTAHGVPATRFMADRMVIKLGVYLRILGFDTAWDLDATTGRLIGRANAEDRVFLTRNGRLADQHPHVNRMLYLQTGDPVLQLRQVIAAFDLNPHRLLFTRCIRCNVALETVESKAAIAERVHPNVYARFEQFYTCPNCGTVFWRGSHVRNTCRKLGLKEPGE